MSSIAIPDDVWDTAFESLRFVQRLNEDERAELRSLASRFLSDKQIAGAQPLDLTAAMQISIAIQACLPILNLGLDWYRGWVGIVVYPGAFLIQQSIADDDGAMQEFVEPIVGEAWDGGPVLLSWEHQAETESGGMMSSIVIHEFAHKLDLLNGEADGMPAFLRSLHPDLEPRQWQGVLKSTYKRFKSQLDRITASLPTDIDPDSLEAADYYNQLPLDAYAAQDESEFFAVSSEAFFVNPGRLQRAFPEWYELLALFYRQDPQRG